MSSDRLDRKRRSEFENSDDSADELPPAKIRKSERTSYFSRVLTDKLKNLFNWITPGYLKNYMIDFTKRFSQPATSSVNMGIEDGRRNNCIEEDEDEIAVIAAQNGTSDVRSHAVSGPRHKSHARGPRHASTTSCPLASTPLSFPMLSSSAILEKAKLLERRQMNGFANKEDAGRCKKSEHEKCVSPITNPVSDIEILLEGETSKKDIEIISEVPPLSRKTRYLTEFYNGTKREKAKYAEDLINEISYHHPPRSHKSYTALEVIRLREKEDYKKLLNKIVKQTNYRPAIPKKERQPSIIHVDLTEGEDKPVTSYHFKKEKVDHVAEFLKCYKPCSLVPRATKIESQLTPSENDKDDVQLIAGSDLPKFTPRNKFTSSKGGFFSQGWIEDLKSSIETDKRKHLQLISQQNDKLQRYKKRRDDRIAEDQRKRDEHRLAGIIFPEDIDMEEDVLPEITQEMEAVISRALGPGDPNEQLSSLDGLTLTRNDAATLSMLNWLNDQVINFYMALIAKRSKLDNYPSVHAFNSFFYTSVKTRGANNVLRWTRRIDIFAFDIILVPLHLGMHWALMVIDNRSKQVKYYDSMGSSEKICLQIIQNYLIVEMQDKKKIVMDPNMYSLEIPTDIPKQMNGSDCGMFSLKYAEYISRDAPITFTQDNMPYFRQRMVYELLSVQLL